MIQLARLTVKIDTPVPRPSNVKSGLSRDSDSDSDAGRDCRGPVHGLGAHRDGLSVSRCQACHGHV